MNKTFKNRYFKQNAVNKAKILGISLQYRTFFQRTRSRLIVFYFMCIEYFKFYILRKVCMPQIELVLTTKCTLRCKNCFNLMPYFDNEKHFNSNLEEIQKNIIQLLHSVDEIKILYILGGEPLMVKHLPQLISFLSQKKQIRHIEIVTNGTIIPNQNLLQILQQYRKTSSIAISDYSSNKLLNRKIRIEEIVALLKKHKIPYEIRGSNSGGNYQWIEYERIYPRHRTKEENIQNFIACKMPCVSMLNQTIHVCPVSSSYYQLTKNNKGGGVFENDYINLAKNCSREILREQIIAFYGKNYFACCDLCQDMSKKQKYISPAIQTNETLALE